MDNLASKNLYSLPDHSINDDRYNILFRNDVDFSRLRRILESEGEVKSMESLRISMEVHRSKLMYTYIREDQRSVNVPKYGSKEIEFIDLLGTEIDEDDPSIAKIWVFKRCKELIGDSCKTEFKITRKMKEVQIKANNREVVYELCQRIEYAKRGLEYQSSPLMSRKLLVLINPFSGQKLAESYWEQAEPILRKANLALEIVRTQRSGHAYELASAIEPGDYDGLITVSGDGLLHEVVNALYRRSDKDSLLKSGFTLGLIPGGTSNGLVKALLSFNNEEYTVENAAYIIARGRKSQMDLTEITQETNPNEKIYSFLSFFWGVLADCDINSECIRWMGSPRFTVWGVYRVFFRKIYEGSIRYNGIQLKSTKDHEDFKKENSFKGKANGSNGLLEESMNAVNLQNRSFTYVLIQNTPYIGTNIHSAPLASLNDGFNDMILQESSEGRVKLANILIQQDEGSYFDSLGCLKSSLGITYHKCNTWTIDPKVKTSGVQSLEKSYTYDENAFFSIDGEKYPAQRIEGRVLKRALPIYF